jgi:hypothetical protein
MLKITDGKGFQMTFANGWTVSVQFGPAQYITNRDINPRSGEYPRSGESYIRAMRDAGAQGSVDAEIAAWDENEEWYRFPKENDTVKGWVSADDVAKFIQEIANK